MKPGKRDEFAVVLLGVLERLDIDPRSQNNTHSDTSSETLREEIQELRGSIDELSKALPRALPTTQPGGYKRTWADIVAQGYNSSGTRVVVPECRTREAIIRAPGQSEDLATRSSV